MSALPGWITRQCAANRRCEDASVAYTRVSVVNKQACLPSCSKMKLSVPLATPGASKSRNCAGVGWFGKCVSWGATTKVPTTISRPGSSLNGRKEVRVARSSRERCSGGLRMFSEEDLIRFHSFDRLVDAIARRVDARGVPLVELKDGEMRLPRV